MTYNIYKDKRLSLSQQAIFNDNFIKFLFWNIPFELKPYFANIEQCFYEIKDYVKFDLYAYLYHRLYDEKIFYI